MKIKIELVNTHTDYYMTQLHALISQQQTTEKFAPGLYQLDTGDGVIFYRITRSDNILISDTLGGIIK